MKEKWRMLPGEWMYDYYVSDRGVVARKKRGGGYKIIGNRPGYKNYVRIRMTKKDGSHLTCAVHHLVAECFLVRPDWGEVIHHINHIKSDNRVSNLAWSTASDNIGAYHRQIREQEAEGGASGVVGPAQMLCSVPLARIRSQEKARSTSSSGWRLSIEMPSPEVLPVSLLEVSWSIPLGQGVCFDPGPEPRYTTNGKA